MCYCCDNLRWVCSSLKLFAAVAAAAADIMPWGPSINDVGPFFQIYDPPPSPCRLSLLNRLMY